MPERIPHKYTVTVKQSALRLNTTWGTNEFVFYDLNNNAIFFVQDLDP
ncbi:hypothetical protein [Gilvibacter sp.]|jgi:hypothetical protein